MDGGGNGHPGLLVSGPFAQLEGALCERVAELRRGRALEPLTIIVGSADVRTHVVDLLARELGAVANVTALTLARCAADLVARSEPAPLAVLAGLARERLVRRLLTTSASELVYFGPVVARPHLAAALAATFADLRQARVPAAAPWATAMSVPSRAMAKRRRAKAGDLELLYGTYCRELADGRVVDDAGLLLAAARRAAGGAMAGRTILYGIYDLNQAQEALVAALLAGGADAFVPVPRGGSRDAATVLAAAGVLGRSERRLAPPTEATDRERVAAVWRAVDGERLALTGDGSFAVVSVPDERVEAREAVREVLSAAEAGARLHDCAVVVPRGDAVEGVAAALSAAGLPVACRRPDRSPGIRLLQLLCDCLSPPAGEPFPRRAVVDLLTVAPLRSVVAPTTASAMWLDEARRAGIIAGLGQWTDRVWRRRLGLERRLHDLEGRAPEPEAEDDADEDIQHLRRRLAAARGLEAAVGALALAHGGLPERADWLGWAEALSRLVTAIFEPAAANAASDVAGRLRALAAVGEEVDLGEATAALRELLAEAGLPHGRVGRSGVAVLTPIGIRGLRFHAVVFTGLCEGGFPVRARPDPILGDAERQSLAKSLDVRLPLPELRDVEATLLFGFACEAARERLVLTTARTDAASGRPRLPSRLLVRLASLAAGHSVGLEEFQGHRALASVWRHVGSAPAADESTVWVDQRERDATSLLGLSGRGQATAARDYLADVLGDASAAGRRLGAWQAAHSPAPGAWDGFLGEEARGVLGGRHPFAAEMHPTRLERYIACPFAFLLRDVLGLDAPEEPGESLEMDALAFGTLAHAILQQTYERVIAERLDLDEARAALVVAWSSCCARAEERGVTGAALAWEVRRDLLRDDLLESLRLDPVFANGDGRPVGVEWRFGEAAGRLVALELEGGRRIRFAGRLDRVDETPAGARVIDYKTGGGGAERGLLKDRLSLQLPVYQMAVRQAGEREYEAVACLYRLVTRRGGFADLLLADDEATVTARLRDLVASIAALVDAGAFPRSSRRRCDFCDLRYACGVSSWVRDRRREHPSLAPVVRLQGPPAKGGEGSD